MKYKMYKDETRANADSNYCIYWNPDIKKPTSSAAMCPASDIPSGTNAQAKDLGWDCHLVLGLSTVM